MTKRVSAQREKKVLYVFFYSLFPLKREQRNSLAEKVRECESNAKHNKTDIHTLTSVGIHYVRVIEREEKEINERIRARSQHELFPTFIYAIFIQSSSHAGN